MDRLAEHINHLAEEGAAKEETQRKEREAMERSSVGIEYERVMRLLANEDVQWWLGQMRAATLDARAAALSLKSTEAEARANSHVYGALSAITGDFGCGVPSDLDRRKVGLETRLRNLTK